MGSDCVSIIVATCNRPAFLRDALDSVRSQSAREAIGQVIVSENCLNRESEQVCDEFKELPLVYIKQRPPVPALLHLQAIWPHVRYPVVACLHDDDWWAPDHLQNALAALAAVPGCAGTFSNYFETSERGGLFQFPTRLWLLWVSLGCDFSPPVVQLSRE